MFSSDINFVFIPIKLKGITLFVCFMGRLIGYFFYNKLRGLKLVFIKFKFILIYFFSMMWFMPILFRLNFNKISLNLGSKYLRGFDLG